ncbi:MAG: hypothetical protein KC619_34535 [Myxococcales bacterium]|nr:hypothetical protein [Myxococcales bacterium]
MTERLTTALRCLIGVAFLSLPAFAITSLGTSPGDLIAASILYAPFLLAGVGVLLKVAAARGLGIGIGVMTILMLAGVTILDGRLPHIHGEEWVIAFQALGALLALPIFHGTFGDAPRLRWTSAMIGIALPVATFYAMVYEGFASGCGWAALLLVAVGVIGLALQKTWSLLALLGASVLTAIPPLAVEAQLASSAVPSVLGLVAAAAIALTWLPWLGPVVRNLRTPIEGDETR